MKKRKKGNVQRGRRCPTSVPGDVPDVPVAVAATGGTHDLSEPAELNDLTTDSNVPENACALAPIPTIPAGKKKKTLQYPLPLPPPNNVLYCAVPIYLPNEYLHPGSSGGAPGGNPTEMAGPSAMTTGQQTKVESQRVQEGKKDLQRQRKNKCRICKLTGNNATTCSSKTTIEGGQPDPYKLTHRQLYVSDIYTTFVRSNTRIFA